MATPITYPAANHPNVQTVTADDLDLSTKPIFTVSKHLAAGNNYTDHYLTCRPTAASLYNISTQSTRRNLEVMIVTQDGGTAKLTYKTTPDSSPSLHTPNVHAILAAIDTDKPIAISGPMSVVPITSATFNPTSWPDALQLSDDTIVRLLSDYPFPIPYNSLTFSDTSVLTHANKNRHFNFLGYITATSISNNSTLVYANLDMFGQPAKVRAAAASAPTHIPHHNMRVTTAPHYGRCTAPATHTACPTKCHHQSIPSTYTTTSFAPSPILTLLARPYPHTPPYAGAVLGQALPLQRHCLLQSHHLRLPTLHQRLAQRTQARNLACHPRWSSQQ
jgi:hypothetical protein